MAKTTRVEDAADACRTNAGDTAIEKAGGLAKWRAMSFNEQLNAINLEIIDQASYFADEYDVTRAQVLDALYVEDAR